MTAPKPTPNNTQSQSLFTIDFASSMPKIILAFIPLGFISQLSCEFTATISFSRYFSNFILPRIIPVITPIVMPLAIYASVIFQPKKPSINTTRYSLISGEVMRNEKVTPKGIPASRKLMKKGIEEQEQKGVTAPNSAPKKLPQPFLCIIQALTFSCGKKLRKNPITEIMTNKSSIIFTES